MNLPLKYYRNRNKLQNVIFSCFKLGVTWPSGLSSTSKAALYFSKFISILNSNIIGLSTVFYINSCFWNSPVLWSLFIRTKKKRRWNIYRMVLRDFIFSRSDKLDWLKPLNMQMRKWRHSGRLFIFQSYVGIIYTFLLIFLLFALIHIQGVCWFLL